MNPTWLLIAWLWIVFAIVAWDDYFEPGFRGLWAVLRHPIAAVRGIREEA